MIVEGRTDPDSGLRVVAEEERAYLEEGERVVPIKPDEHPYDADVAPKELHLVQCYRRGRVEEVYDCVQ